MYTLKQWILIRELYLEKVLYKKLETTQMFTDWWMATHTTVHPLLPWTESSPHPQIHVIPLTRLVTLSGDNLWKVIKGKNVNATELWPYKKRKSASLTSPPLSEDTVMRQLSAEPESSPETELC